VYVEKAKTFVSDRIEDFFLYELQVLNYDRKLSKNEKMKRFTDLLSLVQKSRGPSSAPSKEEEPEQKKIHMCGSLVGPSFLWTRANFDQKTLQVNKYNKLTIEIHSKLREPLQLSKVLLHFNEPSLSHEVSGAPFTVSRGNPVVIEREIYIANENMNVQKELVQFNEIIAEIYQPDPLNNVLAFSMNPYLKPQDDLLDFSS
jgi:hypothetical protein